MTYTAGPFPIQHLLLQWGGKLPGNEQWSCSIRLAEQPPHIPGSNYVPLESDIDSWLNGAIKNAVLSYHTAQASHIDARCKLSFAKLNAVGIDGKYLNPLTHEYVFADVGGGGANYGNFPNQNTVAVSLTTGYSRGPAHRGRFYLPLPTVQIDPNGQIAVGFIQDIEQATKTFLEAVADVPGIDAPNSMTPVVMSRKSGAPAYRVITGVSVGMVMDTQRRRRKSLAENYLNKDLDLGTN
jgi:hypothetical protein